MPLVLNERRQDVLILKLNRPERFNAWTEELEDEYFDLLLEADRSPDVRAIVVTGEGRGFCGGYDLDGLADFSSDEDAFKHRPRPRDLPLTIRKPMVCALNGAAVGLGLVEALYCDVRFAVPGAKLSTTFARRGLIGEYGITWLLPRIVGLSRALDLMLSARTITAEEAHGMGLVDHVVEADELLDRAVAYAQDLAANCSPYSMAQIKRQIRLDLDRGFDQAVEHANQLMLEAFTRPDAAEGVNSYLEKRPAAFPGLEATTTDSAVQNGGQS